MTANKLIFVEALFSLKIFLLLLYFPENVFKMPSYMTVSISFFFFFFNILPNCFLERSDQMGWPLQ